MNVEIVDYDKVAEKCGGVCPDYLPVGKEARIVSINGLGCPCAGRKIYLPPLISKEHTSKMFLRLAL